MPEDDLVKASQSDRILVHLEKITGQKDTFRLFADGYTRSVVLINVTSAVALLAFYSPASSADKFLSSVAVAAAVAFFAISSALVLLVQVFAMSYSWQRMKDHRTELRRLLRDGPKAEPVEKRRFRFAICVGLSALAFCFTIGGFVASIVVLVRVI